MTGRAKRRVVGLGLALFTVWPLAHRALVAAWDVDPWKLGGWAMYVRPRFPAVVEVLALDRPGGRPVPFPFSAADADRVDAFAERRLTLGELAAPADLAEALFAAHPGLAGLLVRVRTRTLDPDTARLVERVERFAYRRGPHGAPLRGEATGARPVGGDPGPGGRLPFSARDPSPPMRAGWSGRLPGPRPITRRPLQ